jgi:hypothetical protein
MSAQEQRRMLERKARRGFIMINSSSAVTGLDGRARQIVASN